MFKSIKVKILVLQTCLILAVAAVIGIATYSLMLTTMKKAQQQHLQYSAEHISENLNSSIKYKKQLLEKITTSEVIKSYNKKRDVNLLLEYFDKFKSQFPIMSLVNEEGQEEFKLVNGEVSKNLLNIKNTALFEEATWHSNTTISTYHVSCPEPNGPYVNFSYCYQNYFDEFVGLVMGQIPIAEFAGVIHDFKFGQSGFALMVDNEGTVLSCPDESLLLKKVSIDRKDAEKTTAQIKTLTSGNGRAEILGRDSYFACAPVQGQNWLILTIQPYKEFMIAPHRLRIITILITMIVLAIGILVSLAMATNIADPIRRLANVTQSAAHGDFTQRVNINSIDEIGYLGEMFNHMMEQLENTTTSIDSLNDVNIKLQASQRQLETAYEKLANTNQQLQEFIYIASHDLREPLRKIMAFGDMLKNDLAEQLNHDSLENFDFMIEGAQRMRQLVDSLLSYSKVINKDAEFKGVNLNEIIKELINLELSIKLEETSGSFYIPETLLSVKGDPTQIRLLIHHLLENALKYHKKDTPPIVTIRTYDHEKGMIRIEIEDNGVGIKREQHKNIFSLFKRMYTQEQYEGTGVGLAICKRIVEKHHGHIGVESQYEQGSKFWFILPASQNEKEIKSESEFEPEPVASHEI